MFRLLIAASQPTTDCLIVAVADGAQPRRHRPASLSLNNVTTAEQPPDSLLAAMAKARIPADNHQFIRRVTAAIGIAEYRAIVSPDKPYIVAKRRDGLPDLHIYHGYTTGFITEQEIAGVAGQGRRARTQFAKGNLVCRAPGESGAPRRQAFRRCSARGKVLHMRYAVVAHRSVRKLRLILLWLNAIDAF